MLQKLTGILALACLSAIAQDLHVSGEKMRAHVKYLASDELEGRGVGTRGEKLATDYIASQLQTEGLKPGGEAGDLLSARPTGGLRHIAASNYDCQR